MGGITLADNPPDDPEGSFMLPNGLCNAAILKDQLNLLSGFAGSTAEHSNTSAIGAGASGDGGPTFSISDFLVPALQTKVWEDWQVADEFSSAFDPQTLSSDPFQLDNGLDSLLGNVSLGWETNSDIPDDQAYDEFVFDLAPSTFDTPATVNVADLIVGSSSMDVSASVSPRELDLQNDSTYHDLALANYYGFNEDTAFDYESGSESSSESDNDDSKDPEDDEEVEKSAIATSCDASISSVNFPMLTTETIIADDVIPIAVACKENPQQLANLSVPVASRDPNKRRMEEDLVTRISNDLGPEHMSGLFRILKGGHEEEEADEVEEMEVDLSSLDEATLVEVYQYVESCCMQTMASILAAEQRERAALEKQKQCSAERTPELSCDPSSSSSLSSSPSPSHPSSHPVSPRSRRSSHSCHSNRKRNGVVSSLSHHDSTVTELQDALWNVVASAAHHPYKPRRKRSNTSAGRRSQETQMQIQQTARSLNSEETLVLCAVKHDLQGNEMEMGEDDAEIDIVGI